MLQNGLHGLLYNAEVYKLTHVNKCYFLLPGFYFTNMSVYGMDLFILTVQSTVWRSRYTYYILRIF
jgi:hypothetical protein